MAWVAWGAAALALIYGGLCAFYALAQERLIFLRIRVGQGYRFRFTPPAEELRLERPDGARLHALAFRTAGAHALLLYFHGHAGSLRRWGRLAPRFTALGLDVLMPDPRGYGKSRGKLSEAALIEDALAWYDEAVRQANGRPVFVYGRSLGSALAVPVAANRDPAALLLETPFANLYDVAWHYLPGLPYRWLLRYPFRNDRAVKRVRCPVHLYHGRRDAVVPLSSALRLYAAIPSGTPREMLVFRKGRHNDLYRFGRFRRALARALAPPGTYLRRPFNPT
jgi:hypothetical protein